MGGLVVSIFVFSLILPAIAEKQCSKLDILSTSLFYHFLNSLIQYANFFKIHQIYNIKKAIGGLLEGEGRGGKGS